MCKKRLVTLLTVFSVFRKSWLSMSWTMSDNDARGSEGPLLLSHESNMYLQGHVAELTKVKRLRPFLSPPPQLKICMCSSSCSNIVYSKVISSGSHRSLSAPACCRTASPRRQRASCTTPTGTGGTGHPRWPTPDSAQPQHPGTARGKYTPDPPTSGASTPTRARPPLRSRMRPCRLDAPVMRSDVALRCVALRRGEARN